MDKKVGQPLQSLPRDSQRQPVQVGAEMATTNGQFTSPFSAPTSPTPFKLQDRVAEVIFSPSEDLYISEDPAMASYYTIAKGTAEAIGVATVNKIYIQSPSGAVVNFRLTLI